MVSALESARTGYLRHLREVRQASPHTVRNYGRDLERFLAFLREGGRPLPAPARITTPRLRLHVGRLSEEGLAGSSLARHLSSLRGFFGWMEETGKIPSNPAAALRTPRPRRRLPHFLEEEDVEALLAAPRREDAHGLRDRAILEVLYSTGGRASEIVGLDESDLDLRRGVALLRGKGRKERLGMLGRPAVEALRAYLGEKKLKGRNRGPLFLNQRNTRLSDRSLRRILTGCLLRAGISRSCSPHTLRHSFATHMLRRGADLRTLQELLGHRSLGSTQIYTHVSLQHLRRLYQQAHPLGGEETSPDKGRPGKKRKKPPGGTRFRPTETRRTEGPGDPKGI